MKYLLHLRALLDNFFDKIIAKATESATDYYYYQIYFHGKEII
jgi:hypothetical protein